MTLLLNELRKLHSRAASRILDLLEIDEARRVWLMDQLADGWMSEERRQPRSGNVDWFDDLIDEDPCTIKLILEDFPGGFSDADKMEIRFVLFYKAGKIVPEHRSIPIAAAKLLLNILLLPPNN